MKIIKDLCDMNGNKFDLNVKANADIISDVVEKELWSNVERSVKEYDKINKEFCLWREKREKGKGLGYPKLTIPPIQDDIDIWKECLMYANINVNY